MRGKTCPLALKNPWYIMLRGYIGSNYKIIGRGNYKNN